MGLEAKNPYENDDELEGQEARATDVPELIEVQAIHHLGIAVADLDAALVHYRSLFGATVDARELLAEEGIEAALLPFGGTAILLMTPTRDDADLAVFVDEWGPGLHHVGYQVADIEVAIATLAELGMEVVDPEPRAGLAGSRVAYVNPDDLDGTIIQLVQI